MDNFANAIGRQWANDTPMQTAGAQGVFENKDRLGLPWAGMPKNRLRALVKDSLAAGAIRKTKEHPEHPRLSQGDWLIPAEHVDQQVA